MVTTILSWALTYALHSTALICTIWLVTRAVPRISLSMQESLWKLALVGGILTASVQQAGELAPPWGHLGLPQALQTTEQPAVAPLAAAPTSDARPTQLQHRAGELTIVATRASAPRPVAAMTSPARPPSAWPWVLLSLMGAGAVFGLVRLGVAAHRLRKQLANRRDVIEDPLLESWLALCNKAELPKRVRLSASATLPSPVALARREVCIPERAIEGLTPLQQQGMLAHELAHVVRRDAWWLHASAIVEALLFFQPLNHLARRKLEEVAEFQCDDWAARHSGTGVHLAKCLAEVAAWVERQPATIAAPAMASVRSPIVKRIRRLLDDQRRQAGRQHGRPAWRAGVGLGLLGATAWLVPGARAQAEPLAIAPRVAEPSATIVVEDLDGADGHDRARVRIVGRDETVELDVAAPRALPPLPPPPLPAAPPPPPREHGVSIIIQGGWWFDGPFSPWGGRGAIELHGLFDGDDLFDDGAFEFDLEASADAYEDALEEAASAQERAVEAAQDAFLRAREESSWHQRRHRPASQEDAWVPWSTRPTGHVEAEPAPATAPLVSL